MELSREKHQYPRGPSRKLTLATVGLESIVRVRERGIADTKNVVNNCSGAVSDFRNAGQRVPADSLIATLPVEMASVP